MYIHALHTSIFLFSHFTHMMHNMYIYEYYALYHTRQIPMCIYGHNNSLVV